MDTRLYDGDIEEFDFTDFFEVPQMCYCRRCDSYVTSTVWTNRLTGEDIHECPTCGLSGVVPITDMTIDGYPL